MAPMETGLFYSDGTAFHTTTYFGISDFLNNPTITYADFLLHVMAVLFCIHVCIGAIVIAIYSLINNMRPTFKNPPNTEWLITSEYLDKVFETRRELENGVGVVDEKKGLYAKYIDDEAAAEGDDGVNGAEGLGHFEIAVRFKNRKLVLCP